MQAGKRARRGTTKPWHSFVSERETNLSGREFGISAEGPMAWV